jgi:1,4-dihydroxy-2-naphthoate octaprenyltransferase
MLTVILYEFRPIMQNSHIDKIKSWLMLARPPFHTVGILPFVLGTLLAYKINTVFSIEVFILGVSAVILIMLSTYQSGEYFDYREADAGDALWPIAEIIWLKTRAASYMNNVIKS